VLLVLLRFVQGFALGGEWGGSRAAVEHAPAERRGLYTSFVTLGLPAGLILANLVFLFLQGPYMGSLPAAFSELFTAAVRYSGASFSQTIGVIFGGASIIATTLFGLKQSSWLITVYLVALSLVSWLCALGLKETYRRTISHGG
jgi:MFS family permease